MAMTGLDIDTRRGNFYRTFQSLEGMPVSGRKKSLYSTYSTDCVDRKFERTCMINSPQTVNPYLDAGVFRFANQLPDSLKFRKRYGKYLNRRMLYEHYVPQSIFKAFKRGTSLPFGTSGQGPMNQLIDEYLSPDRLRKDEIIKNHDVVQQAINAYRSGKHFQGHKIWTLIVIQIWRERVASL